MKRLTTAIFAVAAMGALTCASADPAAKMPPKAQPATPPPAQKPADTPREPVWFERMDTNGDHVISRQEYLDAMGKRFDRLDANHDGNVDMAEWQRVRKQMERMLREHRKAMRAAPEGAKMTPPADDKGPTDENSSPPQG